jgi:precorrin-2 dehydrogenase / sirohydrochlorin ferrochelatase
VPNPGFQVSLDVQGRTCLVLGGDDEVADKVQRLLDAGAKVTVINPTLNATLRQLTASGKIIHRARLFRAADLEGVVLVINTLRGDSAYSRSLLELTRKERIPLCSVDQPEFSTAMLPALVRRGHLRLAVSTSGIAPALASRLRRQLESLFNDEFAAYLDWLAALREEVQKAEPDAERRRERLREAVEGFQLSGTIQYPEVWLQEWDKPRGSPPASH